MKQAITVLVVFISMMSFGQESNLSMFNNLVGKKWGAEGKWGDGSKFKQEVTLNFSLDDNIVIVNSKGYINKEQTEFGLRNHGIRKFNEKEGKVEFWEFDIFGGLTKGIVFSEGRNILYQYNYGGTQVTDMWEYIDANQYKFTVGVYEHGKWKQVFLSTYFKVIH